MEKDILKSKDGEVKLELSGDISADEIKEALSKSKVIDS